MSTKNITVGGDMVAVLNGIADRLASELGFRPTLTQTIRYLIKKAGME
jgi:hypothetical protein